jgi:hypothetical protein
LKGGEREMIKRRLRGVGDVIYRSDEEGNVYQLIGGTWFKLDKEQKSQLLVNLFVVSGNFIDKIEADLRSPNIIEYTNEVERELEYYESLRDPKRPFWIPPPPPPSGLGCGVYLVYFLISLGWAFLMFLFLKLLGDIMFK